MKDRILRLNMYIGLFLFISSAFLLTHEVAFMKTWFYCFVWWPIILIMDSINLRRTGSSPLSESLNDFLFMAFISVFVWLVFELFNIRLKNWSYHSLPPNSAVRWLGYFIAFASVIPALRELALFFESILNGKRLALFRIRRTPLLLYAFVFLGVFSVLLSLAWPRIFFPLVWLGFIFFLEPVNFWLKNDAFLGDFEREDWTRFWSWALAGLSAGILWELWNFWAGSHWEYSLPYLNFGKIFHMPALGYTGFLPFALEVFLFYQLLSCVRKKMEGRHFLKALCFVFLAAFYIGAFHLIDTYTLFR